MKPTLDKLTDRQKEVLLAVGAVDAKGDSDE